MSDNTALKLQNIRLDVELPLHQKLIEMQGLVDNLMRSGMNRRALEVMVEMRRIDGELACANEEANRLIAILEREAVE
jgi:hypothetical protein